MEDQEGRELWHQPRRDRLEANRSNPSQRAAAPVGQRALHLACARGPSTLQNYKQSGGHPRNMKALQPRLRHRRGLRVVATRRVGTTSITDDDRRKVTFASGDTTDELRLRTCTRSLVWCHMSHRVGSSDDQVVHRLFPLYHRVKGHIVKEDTWVVDELTGQAKVTSKIVGAPK